MQARQSTQVSRPTVVTAPTIEPVSLIEAKRQLFLSEADQSSDVEISSRIQAAREQWEHDTDSAVLTQTLSVTSDGFGSREIALPGRPIQSITHIKYYDDANTLQTLSTAYYSLDSQSRTVRLNWDATWPATYIRWDAVTITYVAGYASLSAVPAIAKQAILLLLAYYQLSNRGDNDRPNDFRAYESLVRRFMRSNYP